MYDGLKIECEIKNKDSINSVILLYYVIQLSEIHKHLNDE